MRRLSKLVLMSASAPLLRCCTKMKYDHNDQEFRHIASSELNLNNLGEVKHQNYCERNMKMNDEVSEQVHEKHRHSSCGGSLARSHPRYLVRLDFAHDVGVWHTIKPLSADKWVCPMQRTLVEGKPSYIFKGIVHEQPNVIMLIERFASQNHMNMQQ